MFKDCGSPKYILKCVYAHISGDPQTLSMSMSVHNLLYFTNIKNHICSDLNIVDRLCGKRES